MSAQDRYTKIIESLVNGEEAKASELLHEAFVEKAREIWSDLVEQDELAEDDITEEELEEAFGDEEADDFLNDIESAEEEIDAEEAFGEADEEEEDMIEPEAELELAGDEEGDEDSEHDFNMDGVIDSHEEEHGELEDKLMSVEDALEDLKAEFAKLMGGEEEAEEIEDDSEEFEESFEELEEAAELKSVGKVTMPDGSDGKASPVSKGPSADQHAAPVKFAGGNEKGGKAPVAKDMGVKHPGEGAALKPEARGHGAEKKGKAE
jgi:hypothetical protein